MNQQTPSLKFNNRLNTSKLVTSEGKFTTTFLTYTGAFLFSAVLLILVHEVGHFLAYQWRGYDAVSIRMNPFMGATSTAQEVQEKDFIFVILGGTIFNLSTALLLNFAQRRSKSAYWIPVKMYAAMAFLIEGMVVIAGLFFEETITDFAWLIFLGWSPMIVGFLGLVFIGISGYLIYEVWASIGVQPGSSRRQILLMNTPIFLYGLIAPAMGYTILPSEQSFVTHFLTVSMLLQWLYLGILVLMAPAFLARIRKNMDGNVPNLTRNASRVCLISGCISWALSFLLLN